MSWTEYLHSVDWNQAGIIVLCSYILGCFTSGYYLVRWISGKDLRTIGSGSVGARNAGRVIGKTGFLLTTILDVAKGVLTVWAARRFSADDHLVLLAMLAVLAGHIWPIQLRFRGGKGMATSLGSLLAYDLPLLMTFLILFLCFFGVMRRTVLPGLFALACMPLVALMLIPTSASAVLLSFWAGLVLVAHRKNFIEEFVQLAARRQETPQPGQPPL